MDFYAEKIFWQAFNGFILFAIIGMLIFVPMRIFRRIKAIEISMKQVKQRFEVLEGNKEGKGGQSSFSP